MPLLILALALMLSAAGRRLYLILRSRLRAFSDDVFSDGAALILSILSAVLFAAWVMSVDKGPSGNTRYYANGVNVTGLINSSPARFLGMLIAGGLFTLIAQYLLIGLVLLLRSLLGHPVRTLSGHGVAYTVCCCLACYVLLAARARLAAAALSLVFLVVGLALYSRNKPAVKRWISLHRKGFIGLVILLLYTASGVLFALFSLSLARA